MVKVAMLLILVGLVLLVGFYLQDDSQDQIQARGSGIIFIDGQGFSVAPSKQFDFIVSQPSKVCEVGLDG